MRHYLENKFDNLIPKNLKSTPYDYKKAKVLTYIHLFFATIIVVLGVTCAIFFPENGVSLLGGFFLFAGLIYIFRKYGNLNLSGNLLAITIALILAPTVSQTGGLFSDNLLWLLIAPLTALLFTSKNSSFGWIAFMVGFTIYTFYSIDDNTSGVFVDQIKNNTASYYVISYTALFIGILLLFLIFKTGQEQVITLLKEKQAELQQQKQTLLEQKETLQTQKETLQTQKEILQKQKDEVTQAKEELEEAQVKLKKLNTNLENFAYTASHDLKEPLRMIGTYTSLIEKSLKDQMTPVTNEYMHFVTDGVSRMKKLLDDLLEFSRLGRNKKQTDNDLNDIMLMVTSNLMARMKETKAGIYSNRLPVVHSSSTEIIQLFQNLISNAIKFQREGVEPEVDIRCREEADQFVFSVRDNGIGIPEEAQERVFGIFERVHSKTEYEGTGIGLSTCKKIVENLGGDIWLKSTEGVGTTFFFSVPKEKNGKTVSHRPAMLA